MLSVTPELSLILFPVDKLPPLHPTPFNLSVSGVVLIITCAFSFPESC